MLRPAVRSLAFPAWRAAALGNAYATAAGDAAKSGGKKKSGKVTGSTGRDTGSDAGSSMSDGAVRGAGGARSVDSRGLRGGEGAGEGALPPPPFLDLGASLEKLRECLLRRVDENTKHILTPPTRFIDTALHDVMQTVAPLAQAGPHMEITDEGKEYKIKIGLPGLKKDEVNINVEHYPAGKRKTEINMGHGGRRAPLLHITAHHEQEEGDQSRFWEDVDTRIQLPEGTDPDQVDAEFKNGLLEIHVPKHPDEIDHKPELKKIDIKAGHDR